MASKWIIALAALAVAAEVSWAQAPQVEYSAFPRTSVTTPKEAVTPADAPESGQTPAPPAQFVATAPVPSVVPAQYAVQPSAFQAPADSFDENLLSTHAEYLLWFFKQSHVPMIFGSIPPSLANQTDFPAGSIIPVFGGNHNNIDYGGQSGGRFGVGYWFDKGQEAGFDVDYFQLEQGSLHANASSNPNGLPIIGPTFFDPVAKRETIILFSDPGARAAALNLSADTRFWGVEANFRRQLPTVFADHLELLAGFRHVEFDENLDIGGASIATDPKGLSVAYIDSFNVHNQFDGPQIGLASTYTYNRLFLDLKAKIAVGEMSETVHINGATDILGPTPSLSPGGILTQPTNIGRYSRTVFTFLPELTVNTGVQLTDHLRAFVGYNLIYIDKLQRVGPAIDGVDGTQIRSLNLQPNMNATRPAFEFQDGRFWAYGLNVGLEFSF